MQIQHFFNLFFLCFGPVLIAQERGVQPLTPATPSPAKGATWAVVIGISDYQDPAIPDLQYAVKDAEVFATYLRSPAGGQLDQDHLKILLNQSATRGQVAAAFDWLMEVAGENDQCIIYFSGHGDMETKTRSQMGFLLTWDSPPQTYIAGAFPIFYLQEVISTLSTVNKCRVVMIADACRSGKLAGNSVGGAQATSANLAKQFANEIKILSCQPNEYSVEGIQWGGGRGAFSFHLVDGLYGMADRNQDQTVTLMELQRYLEDHVTDEVAPQSQIPLVLGSKNEPLTKVIPELRSRIENDRLNGSPVLAAVDSRGLEEDILARLDAETRRQYEAFKKCLREQIFLEPAEDCADFYFEQLIQQEALLPLHAAMRRNYAAALQDEAQQALNAWLKTDIKEITLSRLRQFNKYHRYARYLDRAAELLGPNHYMYYHLLSNKALFEGIVLRLSDLWTKDPILGRQVNERYQKALELQPDNAPAYLFMANNYGWNLGEPDSAYYYAMKAAAAAPQWILPYTNTAYLLTLQYHQYDRAKQLLDRALSNDVTSAVVWNYLGVWYFLQKQFPAAENAYQKALQLNPQFTYARSNLGLMYVDTRQFKEAEPCFLEVLRSDSTHVDANNNLGWLYVCTRRWKDAEPLYRRILRLDPGYPFAWNNLGLVCLQTGRPDEAERYILQSIAIDANNPYAYNNLGQLYLQKNQPDEAEKWLLTAIEKSSQFGDPHFYLACIAARRGQPEAAMERLQKALQKGFYDQTALQGNPDLATLRNGPAWKELMKTYFPISQK